MAATIPQSEVPRPITWVWADPINKNCFCNEPCNAGLPVIAHADPSRPNELIHRVHLACARMLTACPTCKAPFDPADLPETFKERNIRWISTLASDCWKTAVKTCVATVILLPFGVGCSAGISLIYAINKFDPELPGMFFSEGLLKHAVGTALFNAAATAFAGTVITVISERASSLLSNQSKKVRFVVRAIFGALRLVAMIAIGVFVLHTLKHRILSTLSPHAKILTQFLIGDANTIPIDAPLYSIPYEDRAAALLGLYSFVGSKIGVLASGISAAAFSILTDILELREI